MSRSREITCGACGVTEPAGKNGTWNLKHKCPKAGTDASDAVYHACPVHKTLVWAIGPYTTFRTCGTRDCISGKGGKAWRYFAPRDGKSESPIDVDVPEIAPTEQDNAPQEIPMAPKAPTPKTPVATPPAFDLSSLGSLGDMIKGYVEHRASEIATEMVLKQGAERGPMQIEWKVNNLPFAKIDGVAHKALPRMLKLYAAGFRNFLIVGPAGSGKTTLAHNLATAIGVRFGSVSCTSGMSESALTGRAIPNLSTGATAYQSTDFVRCYEGGGVFLIDEVDSADPNVLLVINSALANGHMPVPNRDENPSAARASDSIIVCAGNTWGTGADRQYVGRNQLDAAFLDRFVGTTIEVDYDRDLESSLVGDAHICARVWEIRSKAADLKLRRVVGTRFLLSVTRLVKSAGETIKDALMACTVGWTADERAKVGVTL